LSILIPFRPAVEYFPTQVAEYLFLDLFTASEHADSLLIWPFRPDTAPIFGWEGRLGRHFLVQLKASDGALIAAEKLVFLLAYLSTFELSNRSGSANFM
jgi:hypothetical protein